jgi:LPPG:FO 2-phospho-L-lactate transferase
VHEITYQGAERAAPADGLVELLTGDTVDAIVLCPSNPLISLDPILAVPGLREAIIEAPAPAVAVSPIIKGKAVKGPTAKMLDELGFGADATSVLHRYAGLIDAFVADPRDVASLEAAGTDVMVVGEDIMMTTLADRERVARRVLDAADQVRAGERVAHRLPGAA